MHHFRVTNTGPNPIPYRLRIGEWQGTATLMPGESGHCTGLITPEEKGMVFQGSEETGLVCQGSYPREGCPVFIEFDDIDLCFLTITIVPFTEDKPTNGAQEANQPET